MLSLFHGWDPRFVPAFPSRDYFSFIKYVITRLGKLLEHVEDVTKWKILHMPELDTWHKVSPRKALYYKFIELND